LSSLLNELLEAVGALDEKDRKAVVDDAIAATADMAWVPNPGPQTEAFDCEADETFYGGQAGGGKSDLLIGLALTAHSDSLILRRVNDDAKDLAARGRAIAGEGAGYNGQDKILTLNGRKVRFAGCQFEPDKERFKGRAKDFYGFDEIGDFTLSQYKFITTWNRSAKLGQRCRVVCAGNPPTKPEGLWVIQYWAAWLDPKHPRPAKPGELRWYIRGEHDEDVEVEGRGPHVVAWQKRPVQAKSRTFIPSALQDNPDLASTDYAASLDSLPAALRAAYRDGNFQAELKDADYQTIPTAWIAAAQARWKPDGYKEFTMTAMGFDPAGGGKDGAELAWRHGGWYAPIVSAKGAETADGSASAATIIKHRRDGAPIIVDVGGGYGGSVTLRLKDNEIEHVGFNGANASMAKSKDGSLKFYNKRAEAWWKFREELDPDQEGGSAIALPPDNELAADLAAPSYEVTARGILIESKEDIRKRIGRSPGKGDAAVMCLSEGNKAVRKRLRGGGRAGELPTSQNVGHSNMKRR
jgi:hypothetical protein